MPYPTKTLGLFLRNAPTSNNTPFNKLQQSFKQVTTKKKKDVIHNKDIFEKN
jgi:hypothetical protein